MSVTRQDNQNGSGVPPLNKENKQIRDGSAILAAPTGQNNVAQGKERSDADLGHASQNTPSPERAKVSDTLPVGWEWKTVGEMVAEMQYGTSAKTSEDATGVPVLRMGNIKDGSLVLDSLKYLPANHEEFPALLLQDGDLLFNRTNSAELVGKSAVYRGNPSPSSCASYLIRARLRPDYVPEFLAYYINSTFGRAWVSSVVSQQVGQANVNGTKLKALFVPVPSFAEQRKIVAEIEKQFTRLEAGLAALRRVQANLKLYRAAVLKVACEGRLVPTEAEWSPQKEYGPPHPLPTGWHWTTPVDICDEVVDCHNKTAPYVNVGIPLVRTTNVRRGRIDLSNTKFVDRPTYEFWSRRCRPTPGDILFTREAPMGEAGIIPEETTVCMGQRIMLMRVSPQIQNRYLLISLLNPSLLGHINRSAVGSGVQHLRVRDVESLPIPLPPLSEQTRIVAEVERRLSVVEELEAMVSVNLQRAVRLRQTILQKAFSGRLATAEAFG